MYMSYAYSLDLTCEISSTKRKLSVNNTQDFHHSDIHNKIDDIFDEFLSLKFDIQGSCFFVFLIYSEKIKCL